MKQGIVDERDKQIVGRKEPVLSEEQRVQDMGRQRWADKVLRTKSEGVNEKHAPDGINVKPEKPENEEGKGVTYSDHALDPTLRTTPATSVTPVPSNQASREAMIRWCGIREQSRFSGVKTREQKMSQILAEDEQIEEPKICSQEEREFWEERRYEVEERRKEFSGDSGVSQSWYEEGNIFSRGKGRKTGGAQKKERQRKEKSTGVTKKDREQKTNGSNHARRELLRKYMVNELIHEPGKTDPNSHFKLAAQLLKNELKKPLYYIGILLQRALLKLLGMIISFILPAVPMVLAAVALIYFLTSPIAFFLGLFDDDEVTENPQNITNVVQEMYVEFYGDISTFEDSDANNQVEYIYGKNSKSREVIAVYLAEICMSSEYREMSMDDGYPAYLLVDTPKERERLTAVFEQFNYTEREEITVSGTNDEGEKWEAEAEKMSVYCLSIEQWKTEHLSELTRTEQNLLKTLLEQVAREDEAGGNDGFTGTGTSVPISNLVIPEGVDENLVYMAGFIKAEAGNQPYQGKVAVAYVILNRAGGASGNIKGVLTAPYQFSCYIPYHTVEKYLQEYATMTDAQRSQDACWQAAVDAYSGTAANPIGGMKYYCNPAGCSAGASEQWRRIRARNSGSEIIIIGDHVFCQNCW